MGWGKGGHAKLDSHTRGMMKRGVQSLFLLLMWQRWRERKYIFHKLNMTGHKGFFEGRFKLEKDTLSEGVTEKDKRTGFGIEFLGRIGTQPRKT